MHLIEIFLPVSDNDGKRFDRALFTRVGKELSDRFGGMTAFSRAPADGVTKDGDTKVHDDIIIMEVMSDALDRQWWGTYRRELEVRFRQDAILIRASETERL
jgi:hypothetical protein